MNSTFGDAWDRASDERGEFIVAAALMSVVHRDQAPELLEQLAPDDFSDTRFAAIWEAARTLHAQGQAISKRTLTGVIDDKRVLACINGLSGEPVKPVEVVVAARQVAEHGKTRRLIEAATRVAQYAAEAPSYSEAMEYTATQLGGLADAGPSRDALPWSEALADWEQWMQSPQQAARTTPTPWEGLNDALAGGLHPGRLYVVAGRPGDGKSVALLNLVAQAADQGHQGVIFSVEMGRNEVISRIVAAGARANYGQITRRSVDYDNQQKINAYARTYRDLPLTLIDKSDITVDWIAAECRTLKRAGRLDVVVVDYLQLLKETDSRQVRERQVAHISRSLKILSRELDCVVIAACQLNRNAAQVDRQPQLSDLRESGAIESDADVVILLHHEQEYKQRTGTVSLIVAKNRTGRLTTIDQNFYGHQARIG